MTVLDKLKPYRKTAVGALGLGLTVASAWFDPNSSIGHTVTLVVAIASGYGIYRVPNTRVIPAAVAALKAQMTKPAAAAPADGGDGTGDTPAA